MAMGRLVFISYRRQRGYELAHLVNAELRSRGLRTFLDVADSDPGRFWVQIQAAIRSCRTLVLICTNGSFEPQPGDDLVVREVSEATALGRPIVPVFSQDFKPPTAFPLPLPLPLPLRQAMEHSGVSMDTQFHVAAFDHLSQLVGGRKRSEQRRRVAVLGSLAVLALLASLALGGREIIGLSKARQAADARSEALAQGISALEKSAADERRAAERRQREAEARSKELAQDIAVLEKTREAERRAAAQRQREAE
ncbi:MAG: toll/interleukin-1 receptor domain-containing protein, partial [Betaproteobacteria bacterium]